MITLMQMGKNQRDQQQHSKTPAIQDVGHLCFVRIDCRSVVAGCALPAEHAVEEHDHRDHPVERVEALFFTEIEGVHQRLSFWSRKKRRFDLRP